MNEAVEQYLRDLGDLLWTLADSARADADDDYKRGRAMGPYEAVSLMQQQATAFDLPPEAVGLPWTGRGPRPLATQRVGAVLAHEAPECRHGSTRSGRHCGRRRLPRRLWERAR